MNNVVIIKEYTNESLNQIEGIYQFTLKNGEPEIIVRQGDEFYTLSFYGGVPNLAKAHKNVVKRFMEKIIDTCGYCRGYKFENKPLKYSVWGEEASSIQLNKDKMEIRIFYEYDEEEETDYQTSFKINYCPMCGRKIRMDI